MRRMRVEELSGEAFSPFGTYFNPLDCDPTLGGGNGHGAVRFYPDCMLLLFEHSNIVAISSLVVEPRDLIVTVTEAHLHTEEAIGGFTKDVVFHVGPAGGTGPDPSQFRVFRLPAGWWVRLARGVWHHAPFVIGKEETVGTVILPPATYTADCRVVRLSEGLAIEG